MDIDEDVINGLLALIGFSLFAAFSVIGTMIASLNPDSFLYVEYHNPEDLFIIGSVMAIDIILLFILLNQSSKFRRSTNLSKRYGELVYISWRMIYYTVFFLIIMGIILFYYIQYYDSALAIYFFLTLLVQAGLVSLILYNAIKMKKDYKAEVEDR